MNYDLYREPSKELELTSDEKLITPQQIQKKIPPEEPYNEYYNEKKLQVTIEIEVYVSKTAEKYINNKLAQEVGIAKLINPIIREESPYYKVTDEIIEKIIEYLSKKTKQPVGIKYKDLPQKNKNNINEIEILENIDLETIINKTR